MLFRNTSNFVCIPNTNRNLHFCTGVRCFIHDDAKWFLSLYNWLKNVIYNQLINDLDKVVLDLPSHVSSILWTRGHEVVEVWHKASKRIQKTLKIPLCTIVTPKCYVLCSHPANHRKHYNDTFSIPFFLCVTSLH